MQIESSSELPVVVFDLSNSEQSKINISISDYYLKNIPDSNPSTSIINIAKVEKSNPPLTDNLMPLLLQVVAEKITNITADVIYGDSSENIQDNDTYKYLNKKVTEETSLSKMFQYFYQQFFSTSTAFDVNGYSLIFMIPPDFSGYSNYVASEGYVPKDGDTFIDYKSPDKLIASNFKDFMIFAVEFDIPDQEVSTSEISLSFKQNIEFVSGFTTSGSMSVRYLDTSRLKMYKFHSSWIDYMKLVMSGEIEPAAYYYDSKEVDYMGSFFFLKFKPNMDYPTYIGKAYGVFPKNLPVKDVLGNRTENQLVMFTINYFYAMYSGNVITYDEDIYGNPTLDVLTNQPTVKSPSSIYNEFIATFGALYVS